MHLQILAILLSLFVSINFFCCLTRRCSLSFKMSLKFHLGTPRSLNSSRFSRSYMKSLTFAMLALRFVILNCQTFQDFPQVLELCWYVFFCTVHTLCWTDPTIMYNILESLKFHPVIFKYEDIPFWDWPLCVWADVMTKTSHSSLQSNMCARGWGNPTLYI